jgi:hypothetical protein
VRELMLADGPARFLGGSIESFALPMGALIVISTALYYIFRRPHSVPRMRYLRPAHQTSVGTREPGVADFITLRPPAAASMSGAGAQTAEPGRQAPHAGETAPVTDAGADGGADPSPADQAEGDA